MDTYLTSLDKQIKAQNLKRISINSGGCGKAAAEFYKYFRKKKEYKILGVKVLARRQAKSSIYKIDKTGQCIGYYFDHLVLAIKHEEKEYYVDAIYGIKEASYYRKKFYTHLSPIPGYISIKNMEEYNKRDIWNCSFKTQDIRKLRTFLKKVL